MTYAKKFSNYACTDLWVLWGMAWTLFSWPTEGESFHGWHSDRDGDRVAPFLCLWQFSGHKYVARERLGKFKGQTDLPAKLQTPSRKLLQSASALKAKSATSVKSGFQIALPGLLAAAACLIACRVVMRQTWLAFDLSALFGLNICHAGHADNCRHATYHAATLPRCHVPRSHSCSQQLSTHSPTLSFSISVSVFPCLISATRLAVYTNTRPPTFAPY